MSGRHPTTLSRRHVIASAVGGALLGSSWGMAFHEATSHDSVPGVTVAWNRSGAAALIEHLRRRVLLPDCGDLEQQRNFIEQVTRLMRQRIDVLIAPDDALHALGTETRE